MPADLPWVGSAYKFFSSDLLNAIRDRGSVRIAPASSFRAQESEDEPLGGRSDPLDTTTIFAPGPTTIGTEHPFVQNLFRDSPTPPPVDTRINFDEGAIIIHQHEGYVFCFSRVMTPEVCKGMLDRFGCDMVYRIPHLSKFLAAVGQANPLFAKCSVADVRYDGDEKGSTEYNPDVFQKRPEYAWQREVRAVYEGTPPLEPQIFDVPAIRSLIKIRRNPAAA